MDKIEVLAHIAAPSGFKDDTRYRAQAEAVASFEGCSKLEVYGPKDWQNVVHDEESFSAPSEVSSFDTCLSFSAWRQRDIVRETPAQRATRRLLTQDSGHGKPGHSLRKGSGAGLHPQDSPTSLTCKVTKNQAPSRNLPFKLPNFHAKIAASTVHAARTPEVPRPKTAPAGSVAPKPAGLRKHRRSESSSFESLRSIIPDSQEKRASFTSHNIAISTLNTETSCGYTAGSIPQSTVHEQPSGCQTRPTKRRQTDQASRPSQRLDTPNIAQLLGNANTMLSKPQPSRRISNDSAERATTSSDSAPGWPPKARTKITYPPVPEQEHPTNPSEPGPCDNWLFSSPLTTTSSMTQSVEPERSAIPFSAVSSLPTSIHAPAPPVGHASYTTHLTSSLRTLNTRLPLATSFRPVFVSRDITVLERGYWHLHIPLMPDLSTQAETERPKPADGDAGSSRSRKRKHKPWTEEAFLTFWQALTKSIQSGQAGWGVSVYREDPPSAPLPHHPAQGNLSGETRDVSLKVTCWAEILPHVYLLIWVLSDKRTEGLEMEWRDAGEEVVVRIRGCQREGMGELGEYAFKGGEGRDGRWGIVGPGS